MQPPRHVGISSRVVLRVSQNMVALFVQHRRLCEIKSEKKAEDHDGRTLHVI